LLILLKNSYYYKFKEDDVVEGVWVLEFVEVAEEAGAVAVVDVEGVVVVGVDAEIGTVGLEEEPGVVDDRERGAF
jgi:hypothetical protein